MKTRSLELFLKKQKEENSTLGVICYGGVRKQPARKINARRYFFFFGQNTVPKIDLMFIYRVEDTEALKPHIKVKKAIKQQALTAIKTPKDRPEIFTEAVGDQIVEHKPADVTLLFRTGHTLRGKVLGQTRYELLLEVANCQIFVFKHGLLEIQIHGKSQGSHEKDEAHGKRSKKSEKHPLSERLTDIFAEGPKSRAEVETITRLDEDAIKKCVIWMRIQNIITKDASDKDPDGNSRWCLVKKDDGRS